MKVGAKHIVRDHALKNQCKFELGTYSHNPLKVWLQKMKFPEYSVNERNFSVDWKIGSRFQCNESITHIKEVKLRFRHKNFAINTTVKSPALFEPIIHQIKDHTINLRCLSWKIEIDLVMEMLEYGGMN